MIREQTGQNFMVRILNTLPSESGLKRIEYEGPRIALFTTNPSYFILNSNVVSNMVNTVKKRIIIRTDESIRKSEAECAEVLRTVLPNNFRISKLLFDPAVGEVMALVEGLIRDYSISDQDNAILSEKTGWKFLIRRSPKDPELLEQINSIMARRANERIRFYKEVGEKIFRPRLNKRTEVSLVMLGGFNEIGRSCILVTTNESNVLLDCGINSFASDSLTFAPRFDVTGLNIDDIDCVVLSHAHLDHAGFLPMLLKHGYKGPIYCSEPTIPLTYLLLKSCLSRGGNVLFPVPVLGQTQELVLTLSNFVKTGLLSERICIEKSICKASSIYESYMEYLSKEIKQEIDGYSVDMFTPPKSQIVESKKLRKGSHLIVSPSSMLTHGPSVRYFHQICGDPMSALILTSQPFLNTPARRLIEGRKEIEIEGKRVNVECKVESFTDFTNHSDYGQILAYIKRMRQKLRKVIVNHGDKNKAQNLAASINRILRIHTQHPLVGEAV